MASGQPREFRETRSQSPDGDQRSQPYDPIRHNASPDRQRNLQQQPYEHHPPQASDSAYPTHPARQTSGPYRELRPATSASQFMTNVGETSSSYTNPPQEHPFSSESDPPGKSTEKAMTRQTGETSLFPKDESGAQVRLPGLRPIITTRPNEMYLFKDESGGEEPRVRLPDRITREGIEGGSVFLDEGFGNFIQTTPERRRELRDKVSKEANEDERKKFFWQAFNINRNSKYIEESASADHFAVRRDRVNGEKKTDVNEAIQTYINGGNVDEFLRRIKTTATFILNLRRDIRGYEDRLK